MNFQPMPAFFSIGSIIAIIVLVIAIVLWILPDPLTKEQILGLVIALAVARLT